MIASVIFMTKRCTISLNSKKICCAQDLIAIVIVIV